MSNEVFIATVPLRGIDDDVTRTFRSREAAQAWMDSLDPNRYAKGIIWQWPES